MSENQTVSGVLRLFVPERLASRVQPHIHPGGRDAVGTTPTVNEQDPVGTVQPVTGETPRRPFTPTLGPDTQRPDRRVPPQTDLPDGREPRVMPPLGPQPDPVVERLEERIDEEQGEPLEPVDFTRVMDSVEELRRVVEQVMASDEASAHNIIRMAQSTSANVVPAIQSQFNQSIPLISEAMDTALMALQGFVENVLQPHADVPERLLEESRTLRADGQTTAQVGEDILAMTTVENWDGRAAEAYGAAATVQGHAVQELAGIMRSGSAALARASQLNQVVFLLVSEQIDMTARMAETLLTLGSVQGGAYLRTRMVAQMVRRLLEECTQYVDEVSEGQVAQELSEQIDALLDLPALLEPLAWPTGGEKADVEPADTGSAIPGEGADDEPVRQPPVEDQPGEPTPGMPRIGHGDEPRTPMDEAARPEVGHGDDAPEQRYRVWEDTGHRT